MLEAKAGIRDPAGIACEESFPMMYLVIRAHRSEYPFPIAFDKGAPLSVGERYEGPEEWAGWYFCTTPGQQGGWVPEQLIERIDADSGVARERYTARELEVEVGEEVEGLRRLNGWIWCRRKPERDSGWVPEDHLAPH
ncbi:hypothetical protein [Pseudomonas aeruginosa]|uniref:hypothetical protein n=1 Tax=Pseudomonas aeruginosa TaxID=287 RepID=UPI001F09846B|nr:hypothetical protein [Pseudomonas aeruginosa]